MRKYSGQFAPIARNDERRRSPLSPNPRKRKTRGVVDTSVLVAGISGFRKPYVRGKNPSADLLYKWAEKGNFVWLQPRDRAIEPVRPTPQERSRYLACRALKTAAGQDAPRKK